MRWPIDSTSAERCLDRKPGLQPVSDRLFGQARFAEMVGQQLGPGFDSLREAVLERRGDPSVEFLFRFDFTIALYKASSSRACLKVYVHAGGRPFWNRISARTSLSSSTSRSASSRVATAAIISWLNSGRAWRPGVRLPVRLPSDRAGRSRDPAASRGFHELEGRSPGPPLILRAAPRLLHHLREFFDEQRDASGAVVDLLDDRVGECAAGFFCASTRRPGVA